jgi:hypothetical protein
LGLKTRDVYDRFEADFRTPRFQVLAAGLFVLSLAAGLVVGLKGEAGFHRVAVLPISGKLVAPGGLGFASDGRAPLVISGDKALVWSSGFNRPPNVSKLPFSVLHTSASSAGEIGIAGLREVARISTPKMDVLMRTAIKGQIEDIAEEADTMAVSTDEGALFVVDKDGREKEAPRPTSITGRRFRTFRERGPFEYGGVLALEGDHYLATATLTGHLSLFDRRRNKFVVAPEPQFPLADPIEEREDPVLYETENTRPIGALAFLSESTPLFAEGEGLRRVDTATGRIMPLTHCPIELVREIVPLRDRRTLVVLTSSTLEVLRFTSDDLTRLECKQRATLAPKFAPRAAVAADGETILIAFFDSEPELWRPTFRRWSLDISLPRFMKRHSPTSSLF